MTQSLTEFRSEYLELMLRFLWRQWSALGVAGHAETGDCWAIDPEALLAFTCTIGRYDSRLFDEVLDWLVTNERFINVQRLKTVMRKEGFRGGSTLAAVAGFLAENGKKAKWERLAKGRAEQENDRYLFQRPDGAVLPVVGNPDPVFKEYGWLRNPVDLRGLSAEFPPYSETSLWMRLRALFGVTARCEIVLYLLVNGKCGSSVLARQTYFFHRTIQDALGEMTRSGLVVSTRIGRERTYSLPDVAKWWSLLGGGEELVWVCWPALLSALEAIWLRIQPPAFAELPPLLQMSELRKLMRDTGAEKLARSGVDIRFPDAERQPGMDYLDALFVALRNLLR
ncbi:MAG: hypothetical protein GXP31_11160 [Kiritimatiellaeota bacterium]|nr:hypothetical protein [Kiritimatiellota bacterium]